MVLESPYSHLHLPTPYGIHFPSSSSQSFYLIGLLASTVGYLITQFHSLVSFLRLVLMVVAHQTAFLLIAHSTTSALVVAQSGTLKARNTNVK